SAEADVERIEPEDIVERTHAVLDAERRPHDPREDQHARTASRAHRGGFERELAELAIGGLPEVVLEHAGVRARAQGALDGVVGELVPGSTRGSFRRNAPG